MFADAINPIVVKELRQAVRSRFVTAALMLYLLLQLVVASLIVGPVSFVNGDALASTGRTLCTTLLAILGVLGLFFIPIYSAVRLVGERSETEVDLLYITTIRPGQIVRGKLLAAAAIALLLSGAALPFLVFSYFFRGVDLPGVLLALALLNGGIILVTQATLLLVSLPLSRVARGLLLLIALGGLFSLAGAWIAFVTEGLSGGLDFDEDFWHGVLLAIAIGLSLLALLHAATVALLTPASANRAPSLRILFALLALLWGVGLTWQAITEGEASYYVAWPILFTILLLLGLPPILLDAPQLNPRMRRAIPRRRIWRWLAFPFYSTQASGLVWFALAAALLTGVAYRVERLLDGQGVAVPQSSAAIRCGGVLLLVYAVSLLWIFLWRRPLRQRFPRALIWVFAALTIALGAIVPGVVSLFTIEQGDSAVYGSWSFGNLAAMVSNDSSGLRNALRSALLLAIPAVLLNLPWLVRQMRDFAPPPSGAPEGSRSPDA